MEKQQDIIIRFSIYGLLAGAVFPLLSLLIQSVNGNINFSLAGFFELHERFPAQYLIDFTVVIFTAAGYYTGYLKSRNLKTRQAMEAEFKSKSSRILAFTEKLINREFDAELNLNGQKDPLGISLIKLRDNLNQDTIEQQKRKMEDDQRNWVSAGLASFGDILRISFDNMEDFAFSIISFTVKYTGANQGGLFLVEQNDDQEKYFDLKASYAYDRRKFADRQINWGEGIIGTCALEKKSIYMTDLPENYLEVTSGLGHAPPDNLLIVPLIVQDEVLGIMEIASFKAIRDFEIGFVESLAESTANTLSNLKSNIRTAALLRESQTQAETLAQQEEKMRQSMDQLRHTQEQAAQQAEKFISFTNSVNHTLIRAEFDKEGTLLYANTKFLHKLGYFSNAEVEGQHISMFLDKKDLEWFDPIWKRLSEGGKHYEGYMKHINKSGQDLWTMATYTCVRKDDGEVDKILFLAIDDTEQRQQSLDYEGQIESINRLNMKIDFAPDGKYIQSNELFTETMKFTRQDLEKMSVFDFVPKNELEGFKDTWQDVARGTPFRGQLRTRTKYEDEKWIRISLTAVNDMYGEVAKIICLATDISNERIMEQESRKHSEKLKVQEDQLKLAGVELKKKLDQNRADLEKQYAMVIKDHERLQQSLINDPNIVFSIDQTSRLVFINKIAEDFFGSVSGSVLGKKLDTLFPSGEEDTDPFIQSLIDPAAKKVTGEKKKILIKDKSGNNLDASIYLNQSGSRNNLSYTVYISLT